MGFTLCSEQTSPVLVFTYLDSTLPKYIGILPTIKFLKISPINTSFLSSHKSSIILYILFNPCLVKLLGIVEKSIIS